MSSRRQRHWVKVSAPGVSAGSAAAVVADSDGLRTDGRSAAARMTAETDSEASTPPQPHGPRHVAGEPAQPPPGRRFGLTEGRWLAVARFLVAVGVSAVLCVLLDRFAAPSLPVSTDIVGYPTLANYNSERYLFFRYRLSVYAFPLFAIVGVRAVGAVRAAAGPRSRPAKRTIELVEPVPTARPTPERASWGSLARVLLPAVVVVTACGTRTGHPDLIAVAAGVVYAALVAAVAEVWARRTDGQRWRALSAVNGVGGAVAAVLSLGFVSAHTVVQTATGTRVVAMAGLVAARPRGGGDWVVGGASASRWARGARCRADTADGRRGCDRAVPGDVGAPRTDQPFRGLRRRPGYGRREHARPRLLPVARSALRTTACYPDVLAGSLGRAIFDDSIWGIDAGHTVILAPLFVVSIYLFAVWVSRRNPWFLGLFLLGVIGLSTRLLLEWGQFMDLPVSVELLKEQFLSLAPLWSAPAGRFVAWPITLIVFGETLRRRSAGWAVGLTLLLVVDEILVPETIFGAAPVLACVVAAELVHHRAGQSLWTTLRLTRWCVGTGLAATAVWAAFLAAFGALRAFIDYYVVLAPGHNLEGAWPPKLECEVSSIGRCLRSTSGACWSPSGRSRSRSQGGPIGRRATGWPWRRPGSWRCTWRKRSEPSTRATYGRCS